MYVRGEWPLLFLLFISQVVVGFVELLPHFNHSSKDLPTNLVILMIRVLWGRCLLHNKYYAKHPMTFIVKQRLKVRYCLFQTDCSKLLWISLQVFSECQ
jgi:hypothetical protein